MPGRVQVVPWKCPVCPADILSNLCGIARRSGRDVPVVPGHALKPSPGHFRVTPNTKILHMFFVSRFFSSTLVSIGLQAPQVLPEDLLHGRPLQLPMGCGVGEEFTKSWPTFEQLCVQNLALAISCCFSPTKSACNIRLARS